MGKHFEHCCRYFFRQKCQGGGDRNFRGGGLNASNCTNYEIESTIGIKFTTEDITNFQSRVAKPFIAVLKENIQNRFKSHDVVIFDPKMPKDCST